VEVASVTTARLKLVATTTDSANFEVQARAINGGASDVRVVTTPTLYSTSILLPATEQSYTLPVGTRWFSIINHSIRDLQVSYTLGQSGTNYRVIPRGTCTTHPGVDSTAAITIYMQAAASGGRVEIESWA